MKQLTIKAPSVCAASFSGKSDPIDPSNEHIRAVNDMFCCYYSTKEFASLNFREKDHATHIHKSLVEQIQNVCSACLSGALTQIDVLDEIADVCSNAWDYQACIELLNDILFALLAYDNGNELRPDSYINTQVKETHKMLFQFFSAVLNQTLGDDATENNTIPREYAMA